MFQIHPSSSHKEGGLMDEKDSAERRIKVAPDYSARTLK